MFKKNWLTQLLKSTECAVQEPSVRYSHRICTCFLGVQCLKQVITLKSSPLPQGGQFFSWRDLARDNSKNTDQKHRQIYQLVQNFHLYGGTFIFSQPLVWLNGLQDLISLPDSWLERSEATIQILAIPPAAPELLVILTTFIILTYLLFIGRC